MAAKRTLTNHEVIAWAIDESGYADAELADKLSKTGVDADLLAAWRSGGTTPTKGQLTGLARALRRPTALFYLPRPPEQSMPASLRRTPGAAGRQLIAEERFALREAQRRQRFVSKLLQESERVAVPQSSRDQQPSEAAAVLLEWSGVSADDQRAWKDDREAYLAWRSALEEQRLLVMELNLGNAGLRGFAIADEYAPTIAVATAQNTAARSFTLWHEVAHLSMNAPTSCLSPGLDAGSQTERWCDNVASSVLMPPDLLSVFYTKHRDLPAFDLVAAAAKRFRTSLRATAIALRCLDPTLTNLHEVVEAKAPNIDYEMPQVVRGGSQKAPRRRLGETGRTASRALLDALADDRISELEARRVLKLDGYELSELASLVEQT